MRRQRLAPLRSSTDLEVLTETAADDATALAAAAAAAAAAPMTTMDKFNKFSSAIVNLFPLWTVLFAGAGLARPEWFAWLTTQYFTAALAMLMISMGITLTPKDFSDVVVRPNAIALQLVACYGLMPLLALGLGNAFGLSKEYVSGLVLVGSINGGQASNLCTYIAKGNVALSVVMTTATTLSAILMTPLLCKTLLGASVPIDAAGIAFSTIQVVLAPIAIGMFLKATKPKAVEKAMPFAPIVGMLSTVFLVASAVGQVKGPILGAGLKLQACVALLHVMGGLIGYGVPKYLNFGETACRTMAIETSMKSSAFGFLLAKLHMGAYLARVPSAVSVVWMAVTGSLLAVVWKYIPVKREENFDRSLAVRFPKYTFLGWTFYKPKKKTRGNFE